MALRSSHTYKPSNVGDTQASNTTKSRLAEQLRAEFLVAIKGKGFSVEALSSQKQQELKQAQQYQQKQAEQNNAGGGLDVLEHPELPPQAGLIDFPLPGIENIRENLGESRTTAEERARNKHKQRLELANKLKERPTPRPRIQPRVSSAPRPRPSGST